MLSGLVIGCSHDNYSGPKTMAPKRATSRPYTIRGITYYPQQYYEYDETGVSSHYGDHDGFHGKSTATGEKFDTNQLTAAHKTLPLPCVARITNVENGRSVVVKVNDRGPFISGRMLDVSRKTAQLLGFYRKGLGKVRVETLVQESLALQSNPRSAPPSVMLASVNNDMPKRRLPVPGYRPQRYGMY